MTSPVPTQPEEVKNAVRPSTVDVDKIMKMMEEMANQPKEEYGKRQPGEKCMYEIQRKIK